MKELHGLTCAYDVDVRRCDGRHGPTARHVPGGGVFTILTTRLPEVKQQTGQRIPVAASNVHGATDHVVDDVDTLVTSLPDGFNGSAELVAAVKHELEHLDYPIWEGGNKVIFEKLQQPKYAGLVREVTKNIFESQHWPHRSYQMPKDVLQPLSSWRNPALQGRKATNVGKIKTSEKGQQGQGLMYFMQDAEPFVFYNPEINRTAVICLNQKAGSTTWKLALTKALTRANGGNEKTGDSFRRFNRGAPIPASRNPHIRQMYKLPNPWQMLGGYPSVEEVLKSPDVPRFMFVRNPYARLLSGFVDKIEHAKNGEKLSFMSPHDQFKADGFPDFVGAVASLGNAQYQLDEHFTPLSVHCGMQSGTEWDYYLPVEDMDEWYEPFVQALGIVEDVSTGWTNVSTEWFQNPAHSPCFFVTSGCNSCREMFTPKCGPVGDSSAAAAITANENDNVNNKFNNNNNHDRDAKEKNVDKKITSADSNNNNVGIESMHSRLPSSWHDTEGGTSASTVQQRYTADLARLVSKRFEADLIHFGYKEWNGSGDVTGPNAFQLRSELMAQNAKH
eukprot:gene5263-17584_t